MRKLALPILSVAAFAVPQVSQAALATYSSLVLGKNPLVYYQMDETSGTSATDSGSNAVAGRYGSTNLTLGQTSANPVLGTAIYGSVLNSSTTPLGASIGTGLNPPGNVGTGDFTVEFWFKPTISDDRQDLADMNGGTGTSDFGIFVVNATPTDNATNRLRVYHNTDIVAPTAATAVALNQWYHLAYVRQSGTGTLYLNGSVLGSGADTGSLSTSALLGIGNKTTADNVSVANRPFQGYIDEFAFYGSALSSTDVTTHYSVAVPEPTSMAIIGLAGAALLGRRKFE